MGYEYGFEYYVPDAMGDVATGAMGIVTGIMLVLWFLGMGFSVVMYVLNAVGLYRIANRRGIHHAWLAWVPVGCNWLLGSISDHYQYVAKQKVTSKRKILLILSLVLAAVSFLMMGGVAAIVVASGSTGENLAFSLAIALTLIAYLAMMGLAIAVTVFCYMAYYDLFRSCKPNNAILFLVLSIFINVTLPFFVFICGNSDEGMPERRPKNPASQIPEQPQEEPSVVEEPAAEAEEIPVVEAEIIEE